MSADRRGTEKQTEKPSRKPAGAVPSSHTSSVKKYDGWYGAIRFGCWWIDVDIEGQISELLVGYGSGYHFSHR
jgi:hypothetical protein